MQSMGYKKMGLLLCLGIIFITTAPSYAGGKPSPSGLSVKLGKQVYNSCIGCHSMDRNRTGPKHCGILGRKAGSVTEFEYSGAMIKSGIIWTRETLNQFIQSPFEVIPGTTMGFSGIKDDAKRTALIDYLIAANETKECVDTHH
jgi:cytochrome c